MNVRLPTNVLTTLKAFSKENGLTVSTVMEEAMQRVINGENNVLDGHEKKELTATSISVDPRIQADFEDVVKSRNVKIDVAIRLIAEDLVKQIHH